MSNHSNEMDPEMEKRFAQFAKNLDDRLKEALDHRVGATGRFPRGKLTEKDQGEIGIRIAAINGVVVIDFGKPTAWVGFPPEQARAVAESLVKFANEIEGA